MKTCRQPNCVEVVERPKKRADCDRCFNRLRREEYATDKEYREKIKSRNVSRGRTPEGRASRMLSDARARASSRGLPFNISVGDIEVPIVCPYLGIELVTDNDSKQDNSPTLDRIIPRLGYVRGNVEVISERANRIKNDASSEELFKIASRLKQLEENNE